MAMPILADSRTSRPPSAKGLRISPRMRSATTFAWVISFRPSSRIAKWSPSIRATRSLWRRLGIVSGMRRQVSRRRATAVRSGSPTPFPARRPGLDRSSEIDEEQREVEGPVAPRPLDGMRHAIHEQEAIGQPGERIGHHLHGDVGVRAGQPVACPALSRTTTPRHDIHRYVPSLWRKRY